MRIYDDTTGKGFAVSFLSEAPGDVETRCYLRDEGEDGVEIGEESALDRITLPQLFEYVDEIRHCASTAATPSFPRIFDSERA
jgi:hypothetical protein